MLEPFTRCNGTPLNSALDMSYTLQCISFAVYYLGIRDFCPGLPVLFILGFSVFAIILVIFIIIVLFLPGVGKNDAVQTSDLEMNKYQPSTFASMVG